MTSAFSQTLGWAGVGRKTAPGRSWSLSLGNQSWKQSPCRVKDMGGLGRVILESWKGCPGSLYEELAKGTSEQVGKASLLGTHQVLHFGVGCAHLGKNSSIFNKDIIH